MGKKPYIISTFSGKKGELPSARLVGSNSGGGGGGAVLSVNGKTGAVELSASDVGAATAETVVEVSGATPTITPAANTTYKCGELTSLTISNPSASGAYSIVFTSGNTATETTFPETILGLEDFAAKANAIYEINVLDNRAVYNGWGTR